MDSVFAGLDRYGVAFVGFNVLLQQLGLPIPAVPTMMVASALASAERLSPGAIFAVSVAASVVADLAWFWAGRRYGYPVLRLLCRMSLSPDSCVRQTEGIFEKWGFFSVIVSKFVPGFSTVAPPVAGALRMRLAQFAFAVTLSAALWVGAAMAAGWLFRSQIALVLAWIVRNGTLAGIVLAMLLALYVGWKALQRWRRSRFVHAARISVQELKAWLERDEPPMLVDVGSHLAHGSRAHIPGAVLLDLDEIASSLALFPRDRDIVFYCACPNEVSAKRAAQILLARGYSNVRPMVGGLDAWIAAQYPVEQGVPLTPAPVRARPAAAPAPSGFARVRALLRRA